MTTATILDSEVCQVCDGSGEVAIRNPYWGSRYAAWDYDIAACTSCGGTGEMPLVTCIVCGMPQVPGTLDEGRCPDCS